MNIRGYDQWKTASPYDELPDEPIDLTEKLEREYGRYEHGLCGKDADLDYGGQIAVKECFWHPCGKLTALLSVYATICPPDQRDDESDEDFEYREESYSELVVTWDDYQGYWSGDDWAFSLKPGGYYMEINFPWEDETPTEENLNQACEAIYNAIFNDQKIKDFQSSMEKLSKAGD